MRSHENAAKGLYKKKEEKDGVVKGRGPSENQQCMCIDFQYSGERKEGRKIGEEGCKKKSLFF